MFFSSLRSNRPAPKKTNGFRPVLESLDERIAPVNPHFISATGSVASDGDLVVSFKEAGLGDNQLINYTVTGDAYAVYQWYNHGGRAPQGQPFQTDPVSFTGSGSFYSGKNGQITAKITCDGSIPPPPQDFLDANHASNWVAKCTVTYESIILTDTTNGISTSVSDVSATVVVNIM